MPDGLDVSRWQGAIDWRRVAAAGYEFAYINASNQDPAEHLRGARAAGLATGLYYRLPATADPVTAARAFALHVASLRAYGPGALPPALDLEDGPGDQSARAQRFLGELRTRIGHRRVALYSGAYFFANQLGERWADDDVMLWIADYSAPPGTPRYVSPRVGLHQFSQTGRVPGVNGNVDLNRLRWPLARIVGLDTAVAVADNEVRNQPLAPGAGSLTLVVPVGSASAATARAWISTAVNGPAPGHVRYRFTTDTAALADSDADIPYDDGRSGRFWEQLPDGTTQVQMSYDLPDGGVVCIETVAKL